MTWEPYDDVPENEESEIICDACGLPILKDHGYYLVSNLYICDDCIKQYRQIA